MTSKMKILFVCNKPPYPAREGGPIAMNMLIEGLLQQGHEVKVLTVSSEKFPLNTESIPLTYRNATGIESVPLDLRVKPIGAFLNLFTRRSYHAERFVSGTFASRLKEILLSSAFDVVQLETVFMCSYIPVIRKYSQASVVLRAHNIEYLIWKRIWQSSAPGLRKWYLRHLWTTLKGFELGCLGQVDGIAAITSKDAGFFHKHAPDIPVISLPFGIEPPESATVSGSECEVPSLFHIGSMDWIPNQEGIRWFLTHVWPLVHQEFPGLKLYLAGRNMPAWLKDGQWPDVVVVGEVPDAAGFMQSKQVMVVPLLSGSGIRIKIIEAMAAGKAVISSPVGAEGIECRHGHDILLASAPEEYLESIRRCVANEAFCNLLGDNARQLIIKKHDRSYLIRELIRFYESLKQKQ